ncbi:hypothetical protein [Streptomyces sp. NBC_00328]|nr:hypothetical protein [Streptomyces sp. NBC_00328]
MQLPAEAVASTALIEVVRISALPAQALLHLFRAATPVMAQPRS